MGRRTWESIPPRFRPLKDRVNVVISRQRQLPGAELGKDSAILAASLEEAIGILQEPEAFRRETSGDCQGGEGKTLGRVFVIGGAEVYRAALDVRETGKMLLTNVRKEFECDTFFPLDLSSATTTQGRGEWTKRSTEELEKWVPERDLSGLKKEGSVDFEFCMFEKESSQAPA